MECLYGWCVSLSWCWLVAVGGSPSGLKVGKIKCSDANAAIMLNMSNKVDSSESRLSWLIDDNKS